MIKQHDESLLLAGLNEAQQKAVSTESNRVLVLAGAGSGKTRVLVQRMIWMARRGVSLRNMFAVTFTNKAANEIRERVENELGLSSRGCWFGTFHGLAHRMLRMHPKEARLPDSFQIIDASDQQRIIKRVMRELQVDEKRFSPRLIAQKISACKDRGLQGASAEERLAERQIISVYQRYEALCQQSGLVDFSELLLRAWNLLDRNPALLSLYRERFRLILIDEFQDTNLIQYHWMRQLISPESSLFAVGDDDQSIYGWRGAEVENINRLGEEYPSLEIIRLEQNYRSTGEILELANRVIAHNSDRMPKKLWTDQVKGEGVGFQILLNEYEEARHVVQTIAEEASKGQPYSDFAILYRSNAQSLQFENKLLEEGIPYRIYGGLRFYERAEIKAVLAYYRLLVNRDDDDAFDRVINFPTRGIGEKTQSQIRERSQQQSVSRWRALIQLLESDALTPRARQAVTAFVDLIEGLAKELDHSTASELCERLFQQSGLNDHYKKDESETGKNRLENMNELLNSVREFDQQYESGEEVTVEGRDRHLSYLSQTVLDQGDQESEESSNAVQLMTLHAAKGLEFDTVFMVGVDATIFPNEMALDEDRLNEERRLCYVGITRAERKLHITCAAQRRFYGNQTMTGPSPFIYEMGLLEEGESWYSQIETLGAYPYSGRTAYQKGGGYRAYGSNYSTPTHRRSSTSSQSALQGFAQSEQNGLRLGQTVEHEVFGQGVVLTLEGSGARARVQVSFERSGNKWLMCEYAKLKPL